MKKQGDDMTPDGTAKVEQPKPPSSKKRPVFTVLVSMIIVAGGIIGATYISKSTPKAMKRPPDRVIPLVEVQEVKPEDQRVMISAAGTVIPAREVVLRSRVSGEVVKAHPEFITGGYIKAGAEVLKIDPTDYELNVIQKKRQVSDAHYQLKVEMGRQDVARREWELLNGDKAADPHDMELALRKPQLAKARADLAGAEAELKRAELDLERTSIYCPFNAIVRSKTVEIGSQITAQDALAELIGIDEYWVRLSLPVDHLKWIFIPDQKRKQGSSVRVFHRNGDERSGVVIKLLGDLEDEGRMARLLVSIKDPLDLKNPGSDTRPLLIGEFVRVEIEGLPAEAVYRIQRIFLRDNDTVWTIGRDSTLSVRSVDVIWKDTQTVLIKDGLAPGDKVIISDIAAPVPGMTVKIDSDDGA
jgi:RND family efflux transporter MFP subunit